ncbi:MAG: hypothetical protein LBG06_04675 [Deltaproteobacteria bacterium]|jgi:hypothetical protein|nr:hypothetical protein [Deltaproteobacteria bacterium]
MSRLLFLLGGTALGLIAPKVARIAKELYEERASAPDTKLFNKRPCSRKSAAQARKEAETATPGSIGETAEDAAS